MENGYGTLMVALWVGISYVCITTPLFDIKLTENMIFCQIPFKSLKTVHIVHRNHYLYEVPKIRTWEKIAFFQKIRTSSLRTKKCFCLLRFTVHTCFFENYVIK